MGAISDVWKHRAAINRTKKNPDSSRKIQYVCVCVLLFARWLDRNEDDGQIVRELVPDGDGLRLFSECKRTFQT